MASIVLIFIVNGKPYGGTIPWVAVHALDWFQWFAGLPDEVYAAHTTKATKGTETVNRQQLFLYVFPMELSGLFLRTSCVRKKPKAMEMTNCDSRTKGVIEVVHGKAILTTNDDHLDRELELKTEGDFFGDFCRYLNGEGKCLLTMEDTFQVSHLALAALQSADRHEIVSI